MTKEIRKWWEEASKEYQKCSRISTKYAHYGPYSPNENELKLLGNVKGKKYWKLDVGADSVLSLLLNKELNAQELIYQKNN